MIEEMKNKLKSLLEDEYHLIGTLRSIVNGLNSTLAIENDGKTRAFIRVYRECGRSEKQVSAELDILNSLTETGNFHFSRPIKTYDRRNYSSIKLSNGQVRYVAAFEAIDGRIINKSSSEYHKLGQSIRDLHCQHLPGIVKEHRVFDEADTHIMSDYAMENLKELNSNSLDIIKVSSDLGATKNPFGVGIRHGDINPNNILADETKLYMIDFDECDFGCQSFDLASMAFWLEYTGGEHAKSLFDATISGYGMDKTPEAIACLTKHIVHKQVLTLRLIKEKAIIPPQMWVDIVKRADLFLNNAARSQLRVLG